MYNSKFCNLQSIPNILSRIIKFSQTQLHYTAQTSGAQLFQRIRRDSCLTHIVFAKIRFAVERSGIFSSRKSRDANPIENDKFSSIWTLVREMGNGTRRDATSVRRSDKRAQLFPPFQILSRKQERLEARGLWGTVLLLYRNLSVEVK